MFYVAYMRPLRKATHMLKNRAMQVKFVKTENPSAPAEVENNLYRDPAVMNTIAQDLIKSTTITVGLAVGGYKVLTTICKIAEIAAKAKF